MKKTHEPVIQQIMIICTNVGLIGTSSDNENLGKSITSRTNMNASKNTVKSTNVLTMGNDSSTKCKFYNIKSESDDTTTAYEQITKSQEMNTNICVPIDNKTMEMTTEPQIKKKQYTHLRQPNTYIINANLKSIVPIRPIISH